MRFVTIIGLRLRSLFLRRKVEQELSEELQYHLDREAERRIASGMSVKEARYSALQSFRDVEQRREECRDARGLRFIDNAVQDLRCAVRQLRGSAAFACTAVFVLALGIAAEVAIFEFVEAALIKPLPYQDQSRLVAVFESSPGYSRGWFSYLDFRDWQKRNKVFSSIDAYALNGSFALSSREGAEQVPGTRVSAGFFRTLGVTPVLGRDFRPGEDAPTEVRAVVLSYTAWQKRFGGRQDILGRSIPLNGNATVIIGVLPKQFEFGPYGGAEFWATLRATDACEQQRGCHNLIAVGRLKDGVSTERASAGLRSIAQELQREYPDTNRDCGAATLVPLRDFIVGDVRPILLILFSGTGVLLLISLVNVITLLLARSDKRRREFAVRSAMGASSSRLFHQFVIEGLVLASAGCIVGLVFSNWGIRLLTRLIPADQVERMPYLRDAGLSTNGIALACLTSLVAGLVFSAIPLARIPMSRIIDWLRDGARGASGSTWRRFGSGLVVTELALAVVLMVGAGLLGQSLYQLLHVDVGFNANHLAYLQTSWAPGRYETDEQVEALDQRMVEAIRSLPGVVSVGASTAPPINSAWGTASFHRTGRPREVDDNEVINRQVSPDYFTTLRAQLWRGRYFSMSDNASRHLVAIINRTLARRYFPAENPVGTQIYYDWAPQSPMEIVGVVDDIREGALESVDAPALYVPNGQFPNPWPAILIRTSRPETQIFRQAAEAIHQLDPFITVSAGQSMTERINQSPSSYLHRSAAWLVGIFASVAVLLGTVGLYGVVAYSVGQRTREIGVRIAIGAQRSTLYRLILGEAGRLTGIGVVLGLLASLGAARLLRSMLFHVGPWDFPTFMAVAVVLAVCAVLASFVPARRAASINPVEALRAE
jgi:macrolide transport system ATP-binding/permease protein